MSRARRQQDSQSTLHALARDVSRRQFLGEGISLGAAALAFLTQPARAAGASHLAHHPARARHVIYLQMLGGPSQLDLFDYKPELQKRHGQDVPESLFADQRLAFVRGTKKFLGSPYAFRQHGQCGAPVCEHLPMLAGIVDELAFVKSMQTDEFNHGPAWNMLTTGYATAGKPSMGAWLNYGLGNAQADLPDFVVLVPGMAQLGGQGDVGRRFSAGPASGSRTAHARRDRSVFVEPGGRRRGGPARHDRGGGRAQPPAASCVGRPADRCQHGFL